MGARMRKGFDYAAAYDALPIAVAVIERGIEVYRNRKAADVPVTDADETHELVGGGELIQLGRRWYVRRRGEMTTGAVLVTWVDAEDTVRLACVMHALGKSADDARRRLEQLEAKLAATA